MLVAHAAANYAWSMATRRFVVITSARTGSSWLMDVLNGHDGVEGHQELFLRQMRLTPATAGCNDYPRFIEVHGMPRLTRPHRVFLYLERLYRRPGTIGFKLMYSHLRQQPEILAYLALRRVRIVHLVRRNHLDVIVSEELAKLTGTSHAVSGQKLDIPAVSLDAATLVVRITSLERNVAQARRIIRLSGCAAIEVSYEALLDGDEELDRIRSFLDIVPGPIVARSGLVRRGARNHREAITNFDEVTDALSGTPFLPLLRQI